MVTNNTAQAPDRDSVPMIKANSATTTLSLSSLRVICVKCGKPRNPDEVACCLKTNALQETKEAAGTSKTNSVKEDKEDDHFFNHQEKKK